MPPRKSSPAAKPDSPTQADLEVRKHLPSIPLLTHLEPPEGWQLDRALCAAYSAHPSVLCALLLAMINRSKYSGKGSRVALVRAMRALRGKVHFMLQEGRLAVSPGLDALPAMLDRFIVPVPYAESGHAGKSWHPKVCIVRYRPADPSLIKRGEPAYQWRLWLGSRNFTKDDSWDLALFLSSAGKGGSTVPGVREVANRLAQQAAESAAWAPLLKELDSVTWDVPRGIEIKSIELHLHPDDSRRLPALPLSPKSVLAVAPFLDVTSLKKLAESTGDAERSLVSIRPSLEDVARATSKTLETFTNLYELAPVNEDALDIDDADSAGHDQDPEARGLHAKFLWARYEKTDVLYLGSPNLTARGWERNAEIHAHLEIKRGSPAATALAEGFEAFRQRCHRVEPGSLSKSPKPKTSEDVLEDMRKKLAATLALKQKFRADMTVLVATQTPMVLTHGARMKIGRMSDARIPWPQAASEVILPVMGIEKESELLHIEVTLQGKSLHWLQSAPFEGGLPDARDDTLAASYLGLSGLLDLFADELELHGLPEVDREPWDHRPSEKDRQRGKSRMLGFSVEAVLAAWRRAGKAGPEVIQRATKVLDLAAAYDGASAADRAAVRQLKSLLKSWSAVQSALGGSRA